MNKGFDAEKYGMVICPICSGDAGIRSPDDVKVCQNCGGFGFIRKEAKTFDRKGRTHSNNRLRRAIEF